MLCVDQDPSQKLLDRFGWIFHKNLYFSPVYRYPTSYFEMFHKPASPCLYNNLNFVQGCGVNYFYRTV